MHDMETTVEVSNNVDPTAQEGTSPKPFGEVVIPDAPVDPFVTKVSKECLEDIKRQVYSNTSATEGVEKDKLQLLDITVDLLYSSYVEAEMVQAQRRYLAAATALMQQNPQAPNQPWEAAMRIQSDISNLRQQRRHFADRYSGLMRHFYYTKVVFTTDLLENELVLHHEVSRLFFKGKFASLVKATHIGKYFTNAHRPTPLEEYHSPSPPPDNGPHSPDHEGEARFRSFRPDRPFLLPALPSRFGVIFPRARLRPGSCMPWDTVNSVASKASFRLHYSNAHEDGFYTIATYGERIFDPDFQYSSHVPFIYSSAGYPPSVYPAIGLIEDKRGTRKIDSTSLERQQSLRRSAPVVHDWLARKDTDAILQKHKEAVDREQKERESKEQEEKGTNEQEGQQETGKRGAAKTKKSKDEKASDESSDAEEEKDTKEDSKASTAPKRDLVALMEHARQARARRYNRVHDATLKWMDYNKVLGFSEIKFEGRRARMNFDVSTLSRDNPAATAAFPTSPENVEGSYWGTRKVISDVADALAHFKKTSLAYAAVSEEIYNRNNDGNKVVDIMHYSMLMETARERLLESVGIAFTMELTPSGEIQPTHSIDLDRLAMLIDDAKGKELFFQALPFFGEDAHHKLRLLLVALLMEIFVDDDSDEEVPPELQNYLDKIMGVMAVHVLPKAVVEERYSRVKDVVEHLRPGMSTPDGSVHVQPHFPPNMSPIDLVRTEGVMLRDNLSLWAILECAGKLNILSQTLKYFCHTYDADEVFNLLQKTCPLRVIDYILAEGERYCENLQFYLNSHRHHFPNSTSSAMLENLLVDQFENWNTAKENLEVLLDHNQ